LGIEDERQGSQRAAATEGRGTRGGGKDEEGGVTGNCPLFTKEKLVRIRR